MSLLEGKKGKYYKVININLEESVNKRFEILGMTQNTKVEVLNKKKNGSMIIRVRGTRFAIGKNFAEGILVRESS